MLNFPCGRSHPNGAGESGGGGGGGFPVCIYLFKVNNGNTRKMCGIFKINNEDIRKTSLASFWCLYC